MSDDVYEVERVAGRCYVNNEVYFLIEWKGYPKNQNTWECKANLMGNENLITQFKRTYRKQNPGKSILRHETLLLKNAHDAERPTGDEKAELAVSRKKVSREGKSSKSNPSVTIKRTLAGTNGILDTERSLSPLSPLSIPDSLDNESSTASISNEVTTPSEMMELDRPKKKAKALPVVVPEDDIPVVERVTPVPDMSEVEGELARIQASLSEVKMQSLRLQHSLVKSDGVLQFENVYPPVFVVNDRDDTPFPEIFVYTNNLIFHSAVPKPDPAFLSGCDCIGKCLNVKGEDFCHEDNPYNNSGKLSSTHSGAIYECNSACTCDPATCPNRVVQRGRTIALEIFKTKRKGWGVRAKTNIKKNTFVEEYLGEVITEEEGAIRGRVYDKIGLSYLFDMDLAEGDDQKYVIDSYICGNSSHFFNHSCSPNLIVYGVFYDSMDPSFHRLAFFSNRDIQAGEELTFDYTGTNNDDDTFSKKFPCHCGSANCRNWIHI